MHWWIFCLWFISSRYAGAFTRRRKGLMLVRQQSLRMVPSLDRNTIPTEIMHASLTGPGCILLACPDERDHFLHKGSILVIEHGSKGSVGVLIDKSTPYSVKESNPALEVFEQNSMFMGGEKSNNMAVMIHQHNLGGFTKYLGYGLYLGGLRQAEELVRKRELHPREFKFIFNCVEWAPGKLNQEVVDGRWDVCVMPPELVLHLDSRMMPSSLWSVARNALQRQAQ